MGIWPSHVQWRDVIASPFTQEETKAQKSVSYSESPFLVRAIPDLSSLALPSPCRSDIEANS